MTTEKRVENLARSFLLTDTVKRCARHGGAIFRTGHSTNDRPGWDDMVFAGFLACEEEGLIVSVKETQKRLPSDMVAYELTDRGELLLDDAAWARDGVGSSPSGRTVSKGDRAMWVWLLRHGGPVCFMDSGSDLNHSNMMHLKVCGVDFDRSSSVRDDVWTTKAGSYAAEETHHGVQAEAVCLCGLVGGSERHSRYAYRGPLTRPEHGGRLEIKADVEGLIALLREML